MINTQFGGIAVGHIDRSVVAGGASKRTVLHYERVARVGAGALVENTYTSLVVGEDTIFSNQRMPFTCILLSIEDITFAVAVELASFGSDDLRTGRVVVGTHAVVGSANNTFAIGPKRTVELNALQKHLGSTFYTEIIAVSHNRMSALCGHDSQALVEVEVSLFVVDTATKLNHVTGCGSKNSVFDTVGTGSDLNCGCIHSKCHEYCSNKSKKFSHTCKLFDLLFLKVNSNLSKGERSSVDVSHFVRRRSQKVT